MTLLERSDAEHAKHEVSLSYSRLVLINMMTVIYQVSWHLACHVDHAATAVLPSMFGLCDCAEQ